MGEKRPTQPSGWRGEIPRRKHRLVAQGTLFRYAEREKGGRIYGICTAPAGGAPPERTDTGTVCRAALRVASGGEQVGVGRGYPEIEKILYICSCYGVTLNELFDQELPPPSESSAPERSPRRCRRSRCTAHSRHFSTIWPRETSGWPPGFWRAWPRWPA